MRFSLLQAQNVLILILLYSPIFVMAVFFGELYLQEDAVSQPLEYLAGYFLGTIIISMSVYLGYIRNLSIPPEAESRVVSKKIVASTIGAGIFISSVRLIPILMSNYGIEFSRTLLNDAALNLVYLVPAAGIFILYRNLVLYNDIAADKKIIRAFKEQVARFRNKIEERETIEENSSENVSLFPQFELGTEEGEITDLLVSMPIMIILMGLSTLLLELLIPGLTLWNIIKLIVLISVIRLALRFSMVLIASIIKSRS